MELNDAQTIVDPASDLRGLLLWCQLNHGCHVTSTRHVHLLAEERVAELLSNSFAFMVRWSGSQIVFPPAELTKRLHKLGGI